MTGASALARPSLAARVAFGSYPGDINPTYTTVTSNLLDVRCQRGRNTERERPSAGTCTPRLDNRDRQLDPTYTGSPYYPNVLPMVPLQVSASTYGLGGYLTTAGSPTFSSDSTCTINSTGLDVVQAPASLVDETQGWFAMRVRVGWASTSPPTANSTEFFSWGDSSGSIIRLLWRGAANSWDIRRNSGGAALNLLVPDSFASGDTVTLIGAWTSTQVKLSVDGAAFQTLANTTIPTIARSVFAIGSFVDGATGHINSEVYWFACGTGTLTNANAATIHAFGNTDPPAGGLPGDATMLWTADTTAYLTPVAETYHLHTGYVERWPLTWETPMWGTVQPTSVDALAVLAQATISGTFPQETTGARVNRVLTAANWPTHAQPGTSPWVLGTSALGTTTELGTTSPNSIVDTGQQAVQAVTIPADQPVAALEHIQTMADAEAGVFFVDGAGYAVFHDRTRRYLAESSVTFSDIDGDGDVFYEDLSPEFDVANVVNDVTVTTTLDDVAVAAEATDDASRERYFRRAATLTLPLTSTGALEDRAAYEVRLKAQPRLRISRIVVRPESQPAAWPLLLNLEISDRVTVRRTPPGGAETIEQDCFVELVQHEIRPNDWTMTFQLSPADAWTGAWILGTSRLGTSTLIAY